jgi:uncharacterized protein
LKVLQDAFYLPVEGGRCFCIFRRSAVPVVGAMLHLPAFGDEMNKARAMTARAARAFAAIGFNVLQIDLVGCGESSGTHRDADVTRWAGNALAALDWLRLRDETAVPPWIWCLRAGALLAPALLDRARDVPLLLWQPVLSGAQQLSQLLRQKLAAGLTGSGADRAGTKNLRQRLQRGELLEIGGYEISPRLADELDRAAFDLPADYRGRIAWFELSPTDPPVLSPAARTKIAALRSTGVEVSAAAIRGPGFWQSSEIEHSNALIEASAAALSADFAHGLSRDTAVL